MASYYSNGYSWYIQWRENGKTRRAKYGRITEVSEAEVRQAVKAKEVELKFGRRVLPTGLVLSTFAETYKDWHAMEYPDSHYRIRQIIDDHLVPAFGQYPLDAIPITEAEAYKALRMHDVSASTVDKELRTLKAMINKAIEWGEIDTNPIRHVKAPRNTKSSPPPFYTADQLMEIYGVCEERCHWWRVLANTGLRRGEALQLKRSDVASDSIRVVSDPRARTKSGKWREVPLNAPAKESIKEMSGGAYVFPRYTPPSFSRRFAMDARSAGLTGSVHWLRHTYCSHLVMAGVPLRTVQKLAGHSTYRVTERYAHLIPGYLRNEADRICL